VIGAEIGCLNVVAMIDGMDHTVVKTTWDGVHPCSNLSLRVLEGAERPSEHDQSRPKKRRKGRQECMTERRATWG
jgi:hypothetical protein